MPVMSVKITGRSAAIPKLFLQMGDSYFMSVLFADPYRPERSLNDAEGGSDGALWVIVVGWSLVNTEDPGGSAAFWLVHVLYNFVILATTPLTPVCLSP